MNTIRTAVLLLCFACGASTLAAQSPIPLGDRLELFADDFLIEKLEGTQLKLHEPVLAGVALKFDEPWEGAFSAYATIIRDGSLLRLYYRGIPSLTNQEVTCYAESKDGIVWEKPRLGLFEVSGTRENNVILAGMKPFSGNFSPFLDSRPGVPAAERFKALAGSDKTGLVAFKSEDGIHWGKLRETPVMTRGVFDSQNVAFWSPAEKCYVAYFRTWTDGLYKGFRTISRTASTNFLDWSEPKEMHFGPAPLEHLYTSQTHPYFRAPHIYIATPMRFFPGRSPLTPDQIANLEIIKGYSRDCTDTVLMTSRGGERYDRLFMEAFMRPGPDPGNWASRASLTVLGIIPGGPSEMFIYKQAHYAQPDAHLLRYTLRTDGFVSVNAPYAGGEMLTKPITFSGRELILNFSTSAAGSLRVEILDQNGTPVPGFTASDATEHFGDSVERVVQWQNGLSLASLAGKTIRLRFIMKDADLFSMRFRP